MVHVSDISTPALLVQRSTFEANVASAEQMVRGTGKRLRPHFKTHRTPALALREVTPAVIGATCATVGEAEVLVRAGIADVLIANEFVTPDKIRRIALLAARARILVAADAEGPLEALSSAATVVRSTVGVLVDFDVGLGRCGVASPAQAQRLATMTARLPGLRFAGIMGYEGRIKSSDAGGANRLARAFESLAEAKAAVEAAGLKAEVVSGGGTATIREALADPNITEVQAGTYCLMEPDIDHIGLPFRGAVEVLASVISHNPPRITVDAGRRTIGCDKGPPICLEPGGRVLFVSDEHVTLSWDGEPPALGDRIRLRPTQNRTTFNLYDVVWLVGPDGMAEELKVEARGRSQ
jgi:D-serine deaminase-like pyridoxal phosphate-dependent protein